jgi:hypothetical protein
MRESDLYLPVKKFLENQGYEVKGEVLNCDVVAVRKTEQPVVIELKLTLSLAVLLQAVERLAISNKVYIGVPRSCSVLKKQSKRVVKLLRLLNIGLLGIEKIGNQDYVEVLLDPGSYRPRQNPQRKERLLGEFVRRVGDPNVGGAAHRQGLMTVYRQRTLAIAKILKAQGPMKASVLAALLGDPKARDIMYRNVYGWFDSHGKGIYSLSPRGETEVLTWLS